MVLNLMAARVRPAVRRAQVCAVLLPSSLRAMTALLGVALFCAVLFVSQVISYLETGALENPYSVVYSVFMVVWITGFK